MSIDWKKALPFIGALATGGVPALALTAASAVAEALGRPVDATPEAIDSAMKSATPEQMVALQEADTRLKIAMRQADTEDKRIEAELSKAFLGDVGNARSTHANSTGIMVLGYLINVASYSLIGLVLYGCFALMSGAKLTVDPAIAATVGALVGAAVQWVMANAAQANGFFFGSSPTSRANTESLARAVRESVTR